MSNGDGSSFQIAKKLLSEPDERAFVRLLVGQNLVRFSPAAEFRTENSGREVHLLDLGQPYASGDYDLFSRVCSVAAGPLRKTRKNMKDDAAVSGVPSIGAHVAAELGRQLQMPFVPAPEGHGLERPYGVHSEYLIVDDVSSTGKSLERYVAQMRQAGWAINRAFTLYDKQLGAAGRLARVGVELNCLTDFDGLLEGARDAGRYGDSELSAMRAHHDRMKQELLAFPYPGGKPALEKDARILGIPSENLLAWHQSVRDAKRLADTGS